MRLIALALTVAMLCGCQSIFEASAERANEALHAAAPSVASLVYRSVVDDGQSPSFGAVAELPNAYGILRSRRTTVVWVLYRAEGIAVSDTNGFRFVLDACMRVTVSSDTVSWRESECPDGPLTSLSGQRIGRTEGNYESGRVGEGALQADELPRPYDIDRWNFGEDVGLNPGPR